MASGSGNRRRRERAEIDQLVFKAAREMLVRDGVLAGFTLQNIADEADVNRVQLYQNFGSKQAVLKAAIVDLLDQTRQERDLHRDKPFAERRRRIFEQFLANPDINRLEALLAQDGDDEYTIFNEIDRTRGDLARDLERGDLPAGADGIALHVLTAATYMGYCIFREGFARNVDVDADELDERVLAAFTAVLEGYTGHSDE